MLLHACQRSSVLKIRVADSKRVDCTGKTVHGCLRTEWSPEGTEPVKEVQFSELPGDIPNENLSSTYCLAKIFCTSSKFFGFMAIPNFAPRPKLWVDKLNGKQRRKLAYNSIKQAKYYSVTAQEMISGSQTNFCQEFSWTFITYEFYFY